MTAAISLTRGMVALVDDEDFDRLAAFKWCAHRGGRSGFYAVRGVRDASGGKQVLLSMHRVIISAPSGMQVDHLNGDGLDNRRMNLRLCTHRENNRNRRRRSPKPTSSAFKGVSWHLNRGQWVARIRAGEILPNGKALQIHLGYFATELEAAIAYDAAARKHFGEFAACNFSCKEAT